MRCRRYLGALSYVYMISWLIQAQFRLHVVHCVHYALAAVEEFADAWQLQT
jgi:hypothetical protein